MGKGDRCTKSTPARKKKQIYSKGAYALACLSSFCLLPGSLPADLASVCLEDALALSVSFWLIYWSLSKKIYIYTQKELYIQNNPLWLVFQALGRPQNSENARAKMIQFFVFCFCFCFYMVTCSTGNWLSVKLKIRFGLKALELMVKSWNVTQSGS